MHHVAESFGTTHLVFLALALALALGFEFVNGFHDTANAVATVIYTHSLPPWVAVVWSGMWNLIGVLFSSGAVAFGIVSLLPAQLVMNVASAAGFAMVFSLLISAILWNVGTWYLGLPASSSHTLIGSIIGVGLMNSLLNSGSAANGINWDQAKQVGLSLAVSPVVGFVSAILLFLVIKKLFRRPELYAAPDPTKAPPLWIRAILCLTCTGVSFAHGSNDGQKGMGLIMLILVGIIPGSYALDLSLKPDAVRQLTELSQSSNAIFKIRANPQPVDADAATKALAAFLKPDGVVSADVYTSLVEKNAEITATLAPHSSLTELTEEARNDLRKAIYLVSETIGKLNKRHILSAAETAPLLKYKSSLDKTTKFIPLWVKIAVACALGFGTMIGWKRIVVTIGERIGKSHLTYAQGASAEIVAMTAIGLADRLGLPVSTTHVLSSGVAGTMVANNSGLQMATLRNVALAWILTLPVCVFLGATLFAAGLRLMAHVVGLH